MITADDGLRLPSRIWLGKNEDMDQNATAKDNLDAEVASSLCLPQSLYMNIFSILFSAVLFIIFWKVQFCPKLKFLLS